MYKRLIVQKKHSIITAFQLQFVWMNCSKSVSVFQWLTLLARKVDFPSAEINNHTEDLVKTLQLILCTST